MIEIASIVIISSFYGVGIYLAKKEKKEEDKRKKLAAQEAEEKAEKEREYKKTALAHAKEQKELRIRKEKMEEEIRLEKSIADLELSFKMTEDAFHKAKTHFSNGAYNPFWDSIEQVAYKLMSYEECVKDIKKLSYNGVRKEHGMLALVYDLKKLIYKAQCNYGFAMILEQRKTRSVFHNLNERINNIEKITRGW